ncbi:unnamed protein product [Ceutorhynchus assimilis]|uniref:Endonuclease/exonuclease/phosphatase domain-containing protein n=1 Tax=Ceutorhynchus assimilis TaxID=467358 RepID=A0A9N9MCQ8_9CUCU|nr:unnamed protein product [Ceutorhynchus assimilis]
MSVQLLPNILSSILSLGNQRELILLGDLNARAGRSRESDIVGRYGEETQNNNGLRLIELCEQYKLKILNGFFNHKDIHRYTWHQDTRGLKSIIDYVIIKQETNWQIRDTRVYRGIECSSDHYLLATKTRIKFNRDTQDINTSDHTDKIDQSRYKIEGLREPRITIQNRIDQKLNDHYLTAETSELYEHVTQSIHKAAAEALGYEDTNARKNHYLTWSAQLEEQKNIKQQAYYNKWLATKDDNDYNTYKRHLREFKNLIQTNKNETWERKCKEVECYMGGTRSSEAWNLIRSLRKDISTKTNIQPIQMGQWKKHYETALKEDREEYLIDPEAPYIVEGEYIEINKSMLIKAIKHMKNNKAPGPEGIPAELLKNGSQKLLIYLKELFTR